MIRIIFDNGNLIECEHVNRIYIDSEDRDKIRLVDPEFNGMEVLAVQYENPKEESND